MTRLERLAINGGPKSVTNPISPWPIASEKVKAAISVLVDSNAWGLYDGASTNQLQQCMESLFDCTHSLLTCSGTMAVELALRGVGVKPDSEVILAAYDFPGNFRAIEAIGATPVLVDVVPGGWVMQTEQLAAAISENTSAVLVSHLHGQLLSVEAVRNALPESISIVEDCCQVPGARIEARPCGSFGDVSAFSFGGSKLLSAGRGGAVLSNDELVIGKARNFGARGNDAFPLSQLQAAVLIPQLDELQERSAARQSAVEAISAAVDKVCGTKLKRPETQADSAWYKLPWQLRDSIDREVVLSMLRAEGVPVDIGFRGFAKRTARRCRKVGEYPNAIRAASSTILLHHPALLEPAETRAQIVSGIEKVMDCIDE
ncbi:DegT/DnrJ/EryC1/StrS family aminotransferase [Mariniblastus fucicola]|uniref:L-glutamine:scyllo-inosose aminotransferase n=1 Tax=Mariniblastus fucicola TaxID=980251 RepID=A0A5B9PE21_9BACT|nr:DegT/DnrJ/EryC1/StrS family aminotransferase [Mariniblastus fucicola]QEG23445.1 L-glutamine:scyllo-inosose aminotransferase [Mariniblastus fucicola]